MTAISDTTVSHREKEKSDMATRQDVLELLKACGAVKLYASSGHMKYRLPNGSLFHSSGTPSDTRSYSNALAHIRRELRTTHPDLAATWGRTVSKEKRAGLSFAEKLQHATAILDGTSAVPTEAEFEIVPATPLQLVVSKTPNAPEIAPTENPASYRKPRETKARRSTVLTLTPVQLAQANYIMHAEGEAAMNAFIESCRGEMIEASPILAIQRAPMELTAANRFVRNYIKTEDDYMASVLERARKELETTTTRIGELEQNIAAAKIDLDKETERQLKLEAYIEKHEQLANEAAALLQEILPDVPAEPVSIAAPSGVNGSKKKTKSPANFTIRDVRARLFPLLKAKGVTTITDRELILGMQECGFSGIDHRQLKVWLWSEQQRADSTIQRGAAPGTFAFKPEIDSVETKQPAYSVG